MLWFYFLFFIYQCHRLYHIHRGLPTHYNKGKEGGLICWGDHNKKDYNKKVVFREHSADRPIGGPPIDTETSIDPAGPLQHIHSQKDHKEKKAPENAESIQKA